MGAEWSGLEREAPAGAARVRPCAGQPAREGRGPRGAEAALAVMAMAAGRTRGVSAGMAGGEGERAAAGSGGLLAGKRARADLLGARRDGDGMGRGVPPFPFPVAARPPPLSGRAGRGGLGGAWAAAPETRPSPASGPAGFYSYFIRSF